MIIKEISKEEYTIYQEKNENSHFLNSINWSEFRKTINWSYKLFGFFNEEEMIGAANIQIKKEKMVKLAYAPRGIIFDYHNQELFEEATKLLKSALKKQGVFVLKIDPQVQYQTRDYYMESNSEQDDNVVEIIKNTGYKHLGFVDHFEGMQPRHTIRINTAQTMAEVTKEMDKMTKKRIQAGKEFKLKYVKAGKERLKDFHDLLTLTSERDSFTIRSIEYFENILDQFGSDASLHFAILDYNATMNSLESDLEKVKSQIIEFDQKLSEMNEGGKKYKNTLRQKEDIVNKQGRIEKEMAELNEYFADRDKELILAAGFTISNVDKTWYVYGASHNQFRNFYPTYFLVNNMINESVNKKDQFFDLFGLSGSTDKDNEAIGLYQFKRGFGGEIVEFIGEFDLVLNKPIYFAFDRVFPKIKKLRKR